MGLHAGLSGARPGGWEAFQASRQGRPYPHPLRLDVGETVAKQRALEERYLSPSGLAKYQRAPGPSHRVITREERGWHATGIRFSTPTHMGPAAEILARYLTAQEQATLTSWEPYKAVQRRTGHVTYTRGARAYRRRLGLADTDAAASTGYMAGFTGRIRAKIRRRSSMRIRRHASRTWTSKAWMSISPCPRAGSGPGRSARTPRWKR